MLSYEQLVIDRFVQDVSHRYLEVYNRTSDECLLVIETAARLALETLANTDALYHNVEHTIMVTMAGQAILKGKHLREGGIAASDWTNVTVATLCHDIGFVKGIFEEDARDECATGVDDTTVKLSLDGTDISLTPYHVDRSKRFVVQRCANSVLAQLDADAITSYIEMTRFPIPDGRMYQDTSGLGAMVRAADLIGQLGDPRYLRKIPALFYEFGETGALEALGFTEPGQMRRGYSTFYWKAVRPYLEKAISYLRATHEGKQWIANLHSHVFDVEHDET